MKLQSSLKTAGFTLSEMLVSVTLSSIVLLAAITCGVSLQKSFNAVDNYFTTHMQQIRIIDYLNRDVKRGLIVTSSVDLQTVTMSVPSYIIQSGDPEAIANSALIGTPRSPTVSYTSTGWQVNYGPSATTVVYSINGTSILRTENGVVTTIASSTDQLLPKSTDVELANTEYARTSVTFRPIFTFGNGNQDPNTDSARLGTTLYATAYLRNKRRG
ncbi:MAG TPA: prepilin-type N-terminal cleavage/methylation domain-containing protein [Chthoniobacterales bacterium]|jgi:prepilin-type N-terminal cleavage/methylation domain-containing protein|nr:prepilin-type N-terminal cleavage/methylation domain-containing protein [Chthoniobacterales bacterium]